MLLIDISNNNRAPNWRTMKNHGVVGAYLKATEGATFRDSTSAVRARNARAAGIRVGFYHFARPSGGDAVQEAQNFTRWVRDAGGIKRRDLRPVLDLESTEMPHERLVYWVRQFNQIVKNDLGVGPLFYSFPYFIQRMRLSKPLGYGLWLAAYGVNDGKRYPYSVPSPWRKAVLHQYTSRGYIAGYGPVDMNYRGGSITPLLARPVLGRL